MSDARGGAGWTSRQHEASDRASSVPLRRARLSSTENGGRLLDLAGSATAKSQCLQVLSPVKVVPLHERVYLELRQALMANLHGTMTVPFVSRVKFKHVMEARALIESRAAELACVHINSAGLKKAYKHAEALEKDSLS
jgi:hypothetical protein